MNVLARGCVTQDGRKFSTMQRLSKLMLTAETGVISAAYLIARGFKMFCMIALQLFALRRHQLISLACWLLGRRLLAVAAHDDYLLGKARLLSRLPSLKKLHKVLAIMRMPMTRIPRLRWHSAVCRVPPPRLILFSREPFSASTKPPKAQVPGAAIKTFSPLRAVRRAISSSGR